MPKLYIGYPAALQKSLETIQPLPHIELPISECVGCIAAEDVFASVDSPSAETSLKDGYALRAEDIASFEGGRSKPLQVSGSVVAGQKDAGVLPRGTALRILTGARLPDGADTIVAEEFTQLSDGAVFITAPTEKGRNILSRGSDTVAGSLLMKTGQQMTPGLIGLLATGGCETICVVRKPHVAIIATGDEILLPGQPLPPGKLYASNLLTLNGWCRHFGFRTEMDIVGDDAEALRRRLALTVEEQDAVVTSGGAWSGDKDMMARVLDDLGWEKLYHRVRLGPGKAVGFGTLNGKPVFILPGGPPSNLVAFLVLALPGLLKLCGHLAPGLPEIPAFLDEPVRGQKDWTQAIFGGLKKHSDGLHFVPYTNIQSRLRRMAEAQALLLIPEGTSAFEAGAAVTVKLLEGP